MTKSANVSAISVSDDSRLEVVVDRFVRLFNRSLWFIGFALLLFGIASKCQADCREGLVDRLVDSTHEGAEGFFVATADVECFLRQAELMVELGIQIARYRERAEHADARYTAMLEATALGTEVIATQGEALASTIRRAIRAEDRAEKWYRSPMFWLVAEVLSIAGAFVAGLVVGR